MTFDPAPQRGPERGAERVLVGLFAAFFLLAFAAEIATHYHPAKLSILFMLVFWAPLLALHELGHALAARWLGWHVQGMVIGFGARVATFHWRGVPVEIRALPLEGFVRCVPRNLDSVRLRSAAVYFAGPGIELLFALLLLYGAGSDVLLQPSASVPIIALQSLALASAMGGIINLIPHSTISAEGEIANDGLGILQSFVLPEEHFAALARQGAGEEPEGAGDEGLST